MSFRVSSIGIPPEERVRLCMIATENVCRQAAHYVRTAAQINSEDAGVAPYVRAVYVYQASAVTAERVSIASGEECGSYLRDILHACTAGVASPCVACWITVMMEDTCVIQHAVFAMSTSSPHPQNWTSPIAVQSDESPFQPGAVRWSLSKRPAPMRVAPAGNVCTPPETALAAPDSAPASRDVAPPTHAQSTPTPPSTPPQEPQDRKVPPPAPRESRQPQTAAPAIARSMGTTPCAHSTRTLAKALAAVTQPQAPSAAVQPPQRNERAISDPPQPPPQQQQQPEAQVQSGDEARGEAQPPFARARPPQHQHGTSRPPSSAHSSTAPKRGIADPTPSSSVYDKVERYQVDAISDPPQQPHYAQREREQPPPPPPAQPAPSEASSAALQRSTRSHASPSGSAVPSRDGAPRHAPGGLLVFDSPQAELVVPSNGQQWGDLAYRARYSPRREELWDIASGVMTHNYAQAAIGPGDGEPAYIQDRHGEEAA